ncbi:MAG: hypothetical protein JRC86_00495 [Deltaproteobacteria bacterium]|nr:hypothetical protein [Deltaproteobacteria bacterium]
MFTDFKANKDPETGVPYGVVSLNSLEDWVFEEFLNNGVNLNEEAVALEWQEENPGQDFPDDFWDDIEIDEPSYALSINEDGIKLELGLSCLGGAYNVWVYSSPFRASAAPCSPCCPNAGDLDTRVEPGYGVVCYDLPADWYYKEYVAPCDSCAPSTINGVFCHEKGCPKDGQENLQLIP